MIYVVLGVEFSGTTLTSELIHHSGIKMIDEEKDSYDKGGKYEHPLFQQINKDILNLTNDQVYHLRIKDCPNILADSYTEVMSNLVNKQEQRYEDWGFKDPRTVVTYPLWKHVLPDHKVIAIYRQPSSNWPRHRWRGLRKRYSNAWRAYVHLRQWYEYNDSILSNCLELHDGFILLNYEQLMKNDDEIIRLQAFVNKQVKDMRKSDMYRSRKNGDLLFRTVQWFMRFTPYSTKNMLKRLDGIQQKQYRRFNKNKKVI